MKFSISVPVGGYHPFLNQCLESLAQQTVPLEVALLDASGDVRVRALAQQYSSLFTYVRHGPDEGQSDAILEGWRNTNGDILGWLNADDVLFPYALETVLTVFENQDNPDIVYGHSSIVDADDNFIGYHWSVEPPSDRLFETMNISQPSCFFKRASHDAIGGINKNLHYVMDWDLFIRMRANGARFSHINEPLSKVLWAENTKTASFGTARRQELKRIISENTPKERQAKVFRSFRITHLLDTLRPLLPQSLSRRLSPPGRGTVNGLAADGAISDSAAIPLFLYSESECNALRMRFKSRNDVSEVSIPGMRCDIYDEKGATIIVPDAPFPIADTFHVTVKSAPDKIAFLESCKWIHV